MISKRLSVLIVVAAVAVGILALASPATAAPATTAGKASVTSAAGHAQVTVDPNAPKREYSETADLPWTLWLPKVLAPAILLLLLFVLVWYVWRMSRLRSATK